MTLYKLLEAIRVQDVTFMGDSLSGGIALTTVAGDMTLNDYNEVRRKILGLGREVKRFGMN
jgi:hypothetical protein